MREQTAKAEKALEEILSRQASLVEVARSDLRDTLACVLDAESPGHRELRISAALTAFDRFCDAEERRVKLKLFLMSGELRVG